MSGARFGADARRRARSRSGLASAVAVPVELYDERFTTSLALQAGGSGSLDSRAAAVLLEEWLARGETP